MNAPPTRLTESYGLTRQPSPGRTLKVKGATIQNPTAMPVKPLAPSHRLTGTGWWCTWVRSTRWHVATSQSPFGPTSNSGSEVQRRAEPKRSESVNEKRPTHRYLSDWHLTFASCALISATHEHEAKVVYTLIITSTPASTAGWLQMGYDARRPSSLERTWEPGRAPSGRATRRCVGSAHGAGGAPRQCHPPRFVIRLATPSSRAPEGRPRGLGRIARLRDDRTEDQRTGSRLL